MDTITKSLGLEGIEYYVTHLTIVNCLLPVKMTPMEVKVLAWFMSFTGELFSDRFGATGKKIVREKLSLSHQGLSNYVRTLIEKKFLIERNGQLTIFPLLFPEINQQSYMIKLKNLTYERTTSNKV